LEKSKIKLMVGVPGSGKSTYALNLVRSDSSWVRVSRDDMRVMLAGHYYPGERYETLVDGMIDFTINNALEKGWNVVIDNTHCKIQTLKQTIAKWSKKGEVELEIIGSELSMEQIKEQNKQRHKVVPEDVIDRMNQGFRHILSHKKELDKYIAETSEVVEHVISASTLYKPNKALPKAIIVDIDGTIANHHGVRGPFDWHKVHMDEPITEILNIVRSLSHFYKIVFMSGRDEACRELTEAWLTTYYKGDDEVELYMRAEGDGRKDCIVKEELFMKHVAPKYNVEATLDDRDQVVDLWRNRLGIKCLQVNYGNF
jgi:predicted kinase